jgi:Protein of unknown function (DUF2793)
MNSTARLGFPLLAVGQAQKEVAHNEAIQSLDALVAAAVEEPPLNVPPAAAVVGTSYIVGESPTAEWAGKAHCLATFTSGGWRFIAPAEGVTAYVRSSGTSAAFRAGAWEVGQVRGSALVIGGQQVVGAQAAAIASPSGGTAVDAEARGTIGQILAAMRAHGLIAS